MTQDEKLDAIWAEVREMRRLHETLLTKRPTLKDQAKEVGVHPSTLSRRRKREELRRLAGITT